MDVKLTAAERARLSGSRRSRSTVTEQFTGPPERSTASMLVAGVSAYVLLLACIAALALGAGYALLHLAPERVVDRVAPRVLPEP